MIALAMVRCCSNQLIAICGIDLPRLVSEVVEDIDDAVERFRLVSRSACAASVVYAGPGLSCLSAANLSRQPTISQRAPD